MLSFCGGRSVSVGQVVGVIHGGWTNGALSGLLKDEAGSAEALDKDGFLHTGDFGRVDEYGMLYITARKSEILTTSRTPLILSQKSTRIGDVARIARWYEMAAAGAATLQLTSGLRRCRSRST
jgi:hypothetical protein